MAGDGTVAGSVQCGELCGGSLVVVQSFAGGSKLAHGVLGELAGVTFSLFSSEGHGSDRKNEGALDGSRKVVGGGFCEENAV
jgi:hypothetical protein